MEQSLLSTPHPSRTTDHALFLLTYDLRWGHRHQTRTNQRYTRPRTCLNPLFRRAREDVERAALAEKQARAAAEAAKATAVSGPTEHEEEMFQAQAILKAAVHRLEGR